MSKDHAGQIKKDTRLLQKKVPEAMKVLEDPASTDEQRDRAIADILRVLDAKK